MSLNYVGMLSLNNICLAYVEVTFYQVCAFRMMFCSLVDENPGGTLIVDFVQLDADPLRAATTHVEGLLDGVHRRVHRLLPGQPRGN